MKMNSQQQFNVDEELNENSDGDDNQLLPNNSDTYSKTPLRPKQVFADLGIDSDRSEEENAHN